MQGGLLKIRNTNSPSLTYFTPQSIVGESEANSFLPQELEESLSLF